METESGFGYSAYMNKAIQQYLKEIGKRGGLIGGKATSAAKTAAARKNGKLGGRPRKEDK
jgi:hypothetical protein